MKNKQEYKLKKNKYAEYILGDLKDILLDPWYVFIGVMSALVIRDMIFVYANELPFINNKGYIVICFSLLIISHILRTLKNIYKRRGNFYLDLIMKLKEQVDEDKDKYNVKE
jgi:hypothetical protein